MILDTETILFYIAVAAVFFAGSVLAMVFLFGLTMGKTLKNTRGMVGLILMSALLPTSVVALQNRISLSASAGKVDIINYEVIELDPDNYLVSYNTTDPVISYLELQTTDNERVPLVPTYSLEKRLQHSIIISKDTPSLGKIVVIAGGEEIEIKK